MNKTRFYPEEEIEEADWIRRLRQVEGFFGNIKSLDQIDGVS